MPALTLNTPVATFRGTAAFGKARASWRDRLAYGALWGVAVWLLETAAFVFSREQLAAAGPALVLLLVFWTTRGIALALLAGSLAARLDSRHAWVLFPGLVLLLACAWDGTAAAGRLWHGFGVALPASGQFLFTLWPLFAYGTPLFAFCLIDERSRRAKALLAHAEAARVECATAIDAAQLERLSRRIDPVLLLHSLQEVRAAVAAGDARAGPRMDALVDFLRESMPAVRNTPSRSSQESAGQHGRPS